MADFDCVTCVDCTTASNMHLKISLLVILFADYATEVFDMTRSPFSSHDPPKNEREKVINKY